MLSAIRTSWEGYTADVIKEANPAHIICIGKGVASVLEDNFKKLVGNRYTVLSQRMLIFHQKNIWQTLGGMERYAYDARKR